jgi:hypothetical protein
MRKVAFPINVFVIITLILSCVILHLNVVAGKLPGNKTPASVIEKAGKFRMLLKSHEAGADNFVMLEHGQLLLIKYFE